MTNRERREYELRGLLASHVGRNELSQLLRRYLNIPTGPLPAGTPFVETILTHEFAEQSSVTVA